MAAAFIHPIKWKGNVYTLNGIRHLLHKVEKSLEIISFEHSKAFLKVVRHWIILLFHVNNHLQGKNSNDEQT